MRCREALLLLIMQVLKYELNNPQRIKIRINHRFSQLRQLKMIWAGSKIKREKVTRLLRVNRQHMIFQVQVDGDNLHHCHLI